MMTIKSSTLCFLFTWLLCLSLSIPMATTASAATAVAKPTATGGTLTMEVTVTPGSGDDPMIMVWLETTNGTFVRTLQTFTKHEKYFHDLTVWWALHKAAKNDTDAWMGPTIKWKGSKSATVPLVVNGVNMLDGNHQIRIEQRKDKGGHYKKMCIALPATFGSGTAKGEGYITQIKFTVKK